MSSLPPIDQNTLSWIITGGIAGIFAMIVGAAVLIERSISTLKERVKNIDERRISGIEGSIKNLEDNPLLVAYREFEIAQAKKIINREGMLKSWEVDIKDKLPKEKEDQETS